MKKMLLYLLCLPALIPAQLYIDVDWATFRAPNNQVIMEIYSLFPRHAFRFEKKDDGNFHAQGLIQYALAQRDTVVVFDRFLHKDLVEDTTEHNLRFQKIPDIAFFQVEEGEYDLIIQMLDMNTRKQIKTSKKVFLKAYSADKLQISDLMLASTLHETENDNKFSKYGYDIIPNASVLFSTNKPVIYTFSEIYNLKYDSDSPGNFKVRYEYTDIEGNLIHSFPEKTKKKAGNSAVEINQLPISDLQSGSYLLRLVVTDENGETSTRSKKFYIYNPETETEATQITYDDYTNSSEDELQDIFTQVRILMTNSERKQYEKSTLEGKRNVLRQFWRVRDPRPETPENEFRDNFEQRLEYAQKKFSNPHIKTSLTDRARVYILYGPPDEIDKHPNDVGTKPWEEWFYYEIEGGVVFIFADLQGFGLYELIHSTARNEFQDYNWQRKIQAIDTGTMDILR